MRGSRVLAGALEHCGVEYVFGVAGSAVLGTLDEIRKSNVEYVGARHEQVAAGMATGYAMATRRPTGSISHVGPGAANQIIGIAAAYRENIPIIAITGNEPSYQLGKDVRHEWDVTGIFGEFTKHSVRLTKENIYHQIQDALVQTTAGMPGPVHIDIPRDLEETDFPALDETDFERLARTNLRTPFVTARPERDSVQRVVSLLSNAERPVLIVGNETRWFDAASAVRAFAEQVEIPVVTSHNARGILPESHSHSLGIVGRTGTEPTNQYVRSADLILGVGTRFSDITTDNWELLSNDATIVHATMRPREFNRHYTADVNALSDPKSFLDEVRSAAAKSNASISFTGTASRRAEYERARDQYLDPGEKQAEGDVDPRIVIESLHRIAGDYAYATGGGVHARFGNQLPVEDINGYFTTSNFAGMSQGFPLAMGAQLALDKQVFAIEGDGGFSMVMQDLETAVREDIPVKILILNNGGLFSQAARQKKYYDGNFTGTLHSNPRFDEVARNFGMSGDRVTDNEQVDEAIERLVEVDGPGLLEVSIDPWVGTSAYDRN